MRAFGLLLCTLLAGSSVGLAAWSLSNASVASAQVQAEPVVSELAWVTHEKRVILTETEADKAAEAHLMPEGTKTLIAGGPMRHGDFSWDEQGVPEGKVTVWVDLRRQLVSVYRGAHEIGTAVILYGAPGMDTPRGTFPVLRKVKDYHSRSYDAPMPYSLFITNDGVALHGSDVRYGRATHGCVGLPIEFARRLFEATKVGSEVSVVISDAGATAKLAQAAPPSLD